MNNQTQETVRLLSIAVMCLWLTLFIMAFLMSIKVDQIHDLQTKVYTLEMEQTHVRSQ